MVELEGGDGDDRLDSTKNPIQVVTARFGVSPECVRFVSGRFFLNDSGLTVSPKNENILFSRFLDYQLLSLQPMIYGLSRGAAQKNLDVDAFKRLRISYPNSLDEQKRIVSMLDNAFGAIAEAAISANKCKDDARIIFDAELNLVFNQGGPDWKESCLADLVVIKHGFAFKSEFYTQSGDYVLLTPGNIFEEGGYRDRGVKQKYYDGPIPDGFILKNGDLLVAMTEQAPGLLGSPVIVPGGKRFLHNQRLGLVQVRPGVPWSNEFFFHAFNVKSFRKAIHDTASGVKVRHTSPEKICAVTVAYPRSILEQRRLASRLSELKAETERLEDVYRRKLAALVELKQSILHHAFLDGMLVKEGLAA